MDTLKLRVPDMTCNHCVATLTDAVKRVAPGAALQADLVNHAVTVTGAPDAAAVLAAMREAGYDAQPM